jgi:predicted GNAT family acetyltransferase
MRPDDWLLTEDIDEFLARAGDFLRSRPALHNVPLTDLEKLRTRQTTECDAGATVFGRLEGEGETRAVFYRTPRGRLGLTHLTAEQAGALAAQLAGLGQFPSHVIADHETSGVFADSWQQHTGATPVPFWRTHLYRLGTLASPRPRAEGRERTTDEKDREHVVRWCREFCVEVAEQASIDVIDAGSWDESRFGDRHFTFWEAPDGLPVSMAATTSIVGGMVRVDPVYTPARFRGRGYAGAVTVAVSAAALNAGATDVVLFADPRNPTSNALYQRIGFVQVTDFTGYRLRLE